jgi:hypothetical protein
LKNSLRRQLWKKLKGLDKKKEERKDRKKKGKKQ